MIEVPYEQIVNKIEQQTDLRKDRIESLVQEKLRQLNGLISKEGAAHIIANEHGVQVLEQRTGKMDIKNLLPGMKNVEVLGKVVRKYELREFTSGTRSGTVANLLLGDSTGTIRTVLWGKQTSTFEQISQGSTLQIRNALVKEGRSQPELHINDTSSIVISPLTVQANEVIEKPTRKKLADLAQNDTNVEVLGTIVQVFDPRFFDKCPECGKRVQGTRCETHGEISPTTSYVLNLYLDDGTANVQVVLWANQLQRLIEQDNSTIISYRNQSGSFDSIKTSLLGNIVKIVGKVQHNEMFQRTELVANLVFPHVDPQEEIELIGEETHAANAARAGTTKLPETASQTEVKGRTSGRTSAGTSLVAPAVAQASLPSGTSPDHARKTSTASQEPSKSAKNTESSTTPAPAEQTQMDANDADLDEEIISLEDLEDLD
ncbi:MAG: hypothetical protein HC945_03050 [Nitrosarchaeum sp.]|nr:hypothetical protein [Nitrosarchaeum sp.]